MDTPMFMNKPFTQTRRLSLANIGRWRDQSDAIVEFVGNVMNVKDKNDRPAGKVSGAVVPTCS